MSINERIKMNKIKPIISVVIPVYNVEKFLRLALNSVKNQTFKNFEAIIVNDASTDNSLKVVNDFLVDSRFKLCNCKINGGLSKARNMGTKLAKGKYIYYFDSDDILPTNLFENLLKNFDEKIDLISFNYCNLSVQSVSKITQIKSIIQYDHVGLMDLVLKDQINHAPWSYIFKRQILIDNPYITFPNGHNFEDISFNVELFSKVNNVKIINFSPAGYFYRDGRSGSISNSFDGEKLNNQIEDKLFLDDIKYNILLKEIKSKRKVDMWYVNELCGMYIEYKEYLLKNSYNISSSTDMLLKKVVKKIKNKKYILRYLPLKQKIKSEIILIPIFRNILIRLLIIKKS